MRAAKLSSIAIQKRDAWAARQGVDTYVQEMGAYGRKRDAEIITSMVGQGPGLLLDMPCGTGRYLALAKSLGFDIVAADYSPTMLSVARRQEGVRFVQADVFNPPFEPATFDVILISRLLFHYAHPETIIALLLPALKPDGRMIFDTLNRYSSRWLASQIVQVIRPEPARRLYFERPVEMEEKLTTLGLKVLQHRSAYLLPTRLYRFVSAGATKICDGVERLFPTSLRVLSYWHVSRR